LSGRGPYSDSMDARITVGGEVSTTRDMSTEDLLLVVDRAIADGFLERS
jgi:hypothetical protein